MSGSPVYIDGKLLGAVSYSLGAFPREPIAGITPIGEMVDAVNAAGPRVADRSLGGRVAGDACGGVLRRSAGSWLAPPLRSAPSRGRAHHRSRLARGSRTDASSDRRRDGARRSDAVRSIAGCARRSRCRSCPSNRVRPRSGNAERAARPWRPCGAQPDQRRSASRSHRHGHPCRSRSGLRVRSSISESRHDGVPDDARQGAHCAPESADLDETGVDGTGDRHDEPGPDDRPSAEHLEPPRGSSTINLALGSARAARGDSDSLFFVTRR